MSAVALAVVGKSNEPLYIKEFGEKKHADENVLFGLPETASPHNYKCSLKHQFILHEALDRFEQRIGKTGWRTAPTGVTGSDAMWVGLLCPVEDFRVYGYMTTTQIKFLLVVEDDASVSDQRTVDETIKKLFVKLHRQYVEYILNPFSNTSGPIESKRFDTKVGDCVSAYNRALHW